MSNQRVILPGFCLSEGDDFGNVWRFLSRQDTLAQRKGKATDVRTVTITEARAAWSNLLDAAARGEQITITRRGVPVAMLIPPITLYPDRDAAIEGLKNASRGITLGGLSIREMIEEGRP
jgi:prevent-host-death family protein